MHIQDRALLVQLSISQWMGRKFDKKTTQEVAVSHGVTDAVGRYNKVLLPTNAKLKEVHGMAADIRQFFYRNTLPWGIEGTQMLPTDNYLNFVAEFRRKKLDWEYLVTEFVDDYDRLRGDAQVALGTLYNATDYPTKADLVSKFSIDLAVFPVPSNDFRVRISNEELTSIQQDVETRVQAAEAVAMQEIWKRLHERVKHMADKLADPKAIFRDSMVENARELCALLPRLNFTDDPHLEQMRQEVEADLVRHHPDALRNDPDLRRDAAAKAKDIMDRMGGYMGGV